MKTFECRVYITVRADDEESAMEKVEANLDRMMEVSNDDGDMISFSVSDVDFIED
jgi:thioester reductase-like protein